MNNEQYYYIDKRKLDKLLNGLKSQTLHYNFLLQVLEFLGVEIKK